MIIDKFAESTGEWRGDEFYSKSVPKSDVSPKFSIATSPTSITGDMFQRPKSKRARRRYLF